MSNPMTRTGLKVGWIGLGKMGVPITDNLLKGGFDVTVFDINQARCGEQAAKGAHVAPSVRDLAGAVDVIFSIIPDDAALKAIALGEDGVIAAARAGTVYVDMSTVSPRASETVRDAARSRGVHYVAAPVSGSTVLAETAQLTVFASGPTQAYSIVKPVFDTLSSKQYYVGGDQEARYLKLAINHLVGSTAVLLGEALTLGRKGGLDWKQMLDVIGDSVVASPLIKYKLESLRQRDFSPAFSSTQMLKDMSLVVDAGERAGVRMEAATLVKNKFAAYAGGDGAELDFFSILRAIEADSQLD